MCICAYSIMIPLFPVLLSEYSYVEVFSEICLEPFAHSFYNKIRGTSKFLYVGNDVGCPGI